MRYSICYIVSIIFCHFFFIAKSQDTSDVYYWNKEHRLSFEDFRGSPDSIKMMSDVNSKDFQGAALISTSIKLDYDILSDKILFKIYAAMRRNSSWIKFQNDTASLYHEQGHFDICEIYARILRKRISKLHSWKDVKDAYENTLLEQNAEQKKFDEENTFLYKRIRKIWSEKINNRLEELYPFRSANVLGTIRE